MIQQAGRFRTLARRRGHVTGTHVDARAPALATLIVAVAALTGCGSALAAAVRQPPAAGHLISISSASGSLTGPNHQHLTLRLTDARPDHAGRVEHAFAGARPEAALTYTQPGRQIPVVVELTVGRPRWNAHHHTWTVLASLGRTSRDPRAANRKSKPVRRTFTHAALVIDTSADCADGVVRPYEDCEDAHLAFVDFSGADLTGVNFTGANLTGANLSGADLKGVDLTGADLTDAQMTDSDLTGSDLAGLDLSGDDFIGSDFSEVDFAGANLTGVDLPGANLVLANLSDVNLTDADLPGANLTDADLFGAEIDGADFGGARLCASILPQGGIGGGC